MRFEVFAIGAAIAWAVGGLIAAHPSRELGGPRFVRIRMVFVSGLLVAAGWAVDGWSTVDASDWWPLILSGFIGLTLGDAALFEAFARLGPRRTGILFTANAPMTIAVSAMIYGERFTPKAAVGVVLVLVGVVIAIGKGTRPGQSHLWEEVKGSLKVGVLFGLLGAAGQAVAVLIADPVFDGSLDPWSGAAVRAIAGTAGLFVLMPLFERRSQGSEKAKLTIQLLGWVIVSGAVGMALGKTLMLMALGDGEPGVVSVLVSLSPAMQLPLIWAWTRRMPALGAWAGAALAVLGTALIVG